MSEVWKVKEDDGIVVAAHDNPPMNYAAAMKSYVDAPFDERRAWVREHGAWPEPGSATGS